MKLLKRHIGHSVDFVGSVGIINGRIEDVRHRVATIRYWLHAPHHYEPEGYVTYRKKEEIKTIY